METRLEDFFDFNSQEPINRLAYTYEDVIYKVQVIKKMQELGMKVTIDNIGNICGIMQLGNGQGKTVAIGSHTDSVYDGGQYDGPVGVITGLQVAENLAKQKGVNGTILVPIYACEESSRFGNACLGSKFLNGDITIEDFANITEQKKPEQGAKITVKTLTKRARDFLAGRITREDFQGILEQNDSEQSESTTLVEAVKYAKAQIKSLVPDIEEVDKIFEGVDYSLEAHIEQYHILDRKEKETGKNFIGVITSIGSAVRVKYYVQGEANHTGATEMKERKNAVDATCRIGTKVRKLGEKNEREGTGRSSQVEINTPNHNGSFNQTSALAEGYIDFRLLGENTPNRTLKDFEKIVRKTEKKFGTKITTEIVSQGKPVVTDGELNDMLETVCERQGIQYMEMPSYAGQDTGYIPAKQKTMLFIPSKGGSHNPKEFTRRDSIEIAINVFGGLVKDLLRERFKDEIKVPGSQESATTPQLADAQLVDAQLTDEQRTGDVR